MKIRGKSNDAHTEALIIQQSHQAATGSANSGKAKGLKGLLRGGEDTVDIGLGAAINQTLDPAHLESERRKKIEDLKKQIQAGQYNPSSQDIAQAVGEEIVLEILSQGEESASDTVE